MRLVFNDGSIRDIGYDPKKAAELIFLSQKKGGDVPFRIELREDRTEEDYENMLREIQHYVDQLRVKHRFDEELGLG